MEIIYKQKAPDGAFFFIMVSCNGYQIDVYRSDIFVVGAIHESPENVGFPPFSRVCTVRCGRFVNRPYDVCANLKHTDKSKFEDQMEK